MNGKLSHCAIVHPVPQVSEDHYYYGGEWSGHDSVSVVSKVIIGEISTLQSEYSVKTILAALVKPDRPMPGPCREGLCPSIALSYTSSPELRLLRPFRSLTLYLQTTEALCSLAMSNLD